MIDHEQLLETLKNDLVAAGLDPMKYLATGTENPRHHLGRRCKECMHLHNRGGKYSDGTDKKYRSCRIRSWNNWLTGGEFACKEFEAKI